MRKSCKWDSCWWMIYYIWLDTQNPTEWWPQYTCTRSKAPWLTSAFCLGQSRESIKSRIVFCFLHFIYLFFFLSTFSSFTSHLTKREHGLPPWAATSSGGAHLPLLLLLSFLYFNSQIYFVLICKSKLYIYKYNLWFIKYYKYHYFLRY